MTRMLALSLWRPWPWAFFRAGKLVENRSWPLPAWARGVPIAMHAAKRFDTEALEGMQAGRFGPLAKAVPSTRDSHPGGVVGVVEFSGCDRLDQPALFRPPRDGSDPWAFGPFCWTVSRLVQLPKPIECRGYQRIWRLSIEVEAELRRQTGNASYPNHPKPSPNTEA